MEGRGSFGMEGRDKSKQESWKWDIVTTTKLNSCFLPSDVYVYRINMAMKHLEEAEDLMFHVQISAVILI